MKRESTMKEIALRRVSRAEEQELGALVRHTFDRTAPRFLTRRQFLKTSSGIVAVSFLPLGAATTGCDPVTAGLLISGALALIDTIRDLFTLEEDVKGRVQLVNNGDQAVDGEVLLQLLAQQSGLADEGVAHFSVDPGTSPLYEYGQLFGKEADTHNVKGTLGGSSKKTLDFQIVG